MIHHILPVLNVQGELYAASAANIRGYRLEPSRNYEDLMVSTGRDLCANRYELYRYKFLGTTYHNYNGQMCNYSFVALTNRPIFKFSDLGDIDIYPLIFNIQQGPKFISITQTNRLFNNFCELTLDNHPVPHYSNNDFVDSPDSFFNYYGLGTRVPYGQDVDHLRDVIDTSLSRLDMNFASTFGGELMDIVTWNASSDTLETIADYNPASTLAFGIHREDIPLELYRIINSTKVGQLYSLINFSNLNNSELAHIAKVREGVDISKIIPVRTIIHNVSGDGVASAMTDVLSCIYKADTQDFWMNLEGGADYLTAYEINKSMLRKHVRTKDIGYLNIALGNLVSKFLRSTNLDKFVVHKSAEDDSLIVYRLPDYKVILYFDLFWLTLARSDALVNSEIYEAFTNLFMYNQW